MSFTLNFAKNKTPLLVFFMPFLVKTSRPVFIWIEYWLNTSCCVANDYWTLNLLWHKVLHFNISTQQAIFDATLKSLNANPIKWSNTQTIRRQFADELFECEIVFDISNRKTKTNELLIKYIKIARLFVTELTIYKKTINNILKTKNLWSCYTIFKKN